MSLFSRRIAVVLALAVGAFSRTASAQQLPPPDQARRLMATRPDLVAQLRREIGNSGLTPDQIRARLRAAGYPEDLLDSYLGGRSARGRDSLNVAATEDVLDAVAALGIVDSVDTSELRGMLRQRKGGAAGRAGRLDVDSLFADSLVAPDTGIAMRVDSLGRLVDSPRRQLLSKLKGSPPGAVDTGQTIFGINVFENATTQFDPNLAGPVDANYRLGPGDRLVLLITGDAERAFTLDVTREGFIVIPGVGEVPVANLTLAATRRSALRETRTRVFRLATRRRRATTHFSLNVARLHSNQTMCSVTSPNPGAIASRAPGQH